VIGEDIVTAARACIGTPFMHQGRVAGVGLDCVGLARIPAVTLGLEIGDYDGYSRQPDPAVMEAKLNEFLDLVEPGDMQLGDILWLSFAKEPMHLAIFAGDTIIHAVSMGPGKVVEHGFRAPWPQRVVGVYRYRGI